MVPAEPPPVCVVVATHRRPHLLARLFGALGQQTVPASAFEVVVVDDASGDETPAVVGRLREHAPYPVTLLSMPVNLGPAAARNAGWRATDASVIAFIDDDCVPAPDWLEAGSRQMSAGADVVAGRTRPDPAQRHRLGPFTRTIDSEDGRFVQGCNVFYRRRALTTLGGFDERLRTGEDTDLALRAREQGSCVRVAPDVNVCHDVRPRSFRASVRETLRWVDIPYLVRRHPQATRGMFHGSIWWKRSHPPTALALVGLATSAALRKPWPLLAFAPWLRQRLVTAPAAADVGDRVRTLPGVFVIDALEVLVMARGSVKHGARLL
jgi:GT2 family glycosyltransferase